MGKTDDRYIVPGLARGMEVLTAFSPSRKSLSLAELAAALGTTRSALFRVTYTLTTLGFLVQDRGRQSFSLGPAVLRLGVGYLATRSLVEAALPLLESLRDRTGWSAHLGVLEGRTLVYLLRLPTHRRLSIVHEGSRLPAEATSMGRVLLAGLDRVALADLYRHAPPVSPAAPLRGGMATLLAQAQRDARRGHVEHRGEFESGMASIAAPVRDAAGVVAAISITAPMSEVEWDRTPAVLDAACELSAALGFGSPRAAAPRLTPPPAAG